MDSRYFQQMLATLAQERGITPQEVYKEIQIAINEAQKSNEPAIQARWRNVPRKGKNVTPEEFIEYASSVLLK